MIYVVNSGDSLTAIARQYGTSVSRLRGDNGLLADQPLVPGQALVVLQPTETYTVKPGDTLYSIAAQAGLTVLELLQYNPVLAQGQPLFPGETLALGLEGERQGPYTINGYAYPHIRSYVLRRAMPFLTDLSIFSYGFREDGSLIAPQDGALLAEAERFGAGAMLVLTSIDENGSFSTQHASRLFQDQRLQDKVLDNLIQVMLEKGYRGLDSDFEYIAKEDAGAYQAFLGNARERLHREGMVLHVDLAPKTYAGQQGLLYEGHDYGVIGSLADSVLLMTYEWGYVYGPPMAVAPLPRVEEVLRYALSEIPAWKILIGVPNYGYDWTLPHAEERRAVTVGNQEAVLLAAQMGAEIQFDESAQAPFFHYSRNGRRHVVWFEDARSIAAKLGLVRENALAGWAYWNLLRPFSQNWALVSNNILVRRRGEALI